MIGEGVTHLIRSRKNLSLNLPNSSHPDMDIHRTPLGHFNLNYTDRFHDIRVCSGL